jgi:hypothetical protein
MRVFSFLMIEPASTGAAHRNICRNKGAAHRNIILMQTPKQNGISIWSLPIKQVLHGWFVVHLFWQKNLC